MAGRPEEVTFDIPETPDIVTLGCLFLSLSGFSGAFYLYINMVPCSNMFCFDMAIAALLQLSGVLIGVTCGVVYAVRMIGRSIKRRKQRKTTNSGGMMTFWTVTAIIVAGAVVSAYLIVYGKTDSETLDHQPNRMQLYTRLVSEYHLCAFGNPSVHYPFEQDCLRWWSRYVHSDLICNGRWDREDCFGEWAMANKDPSICMKNLPNFRYGSCIAPYIALTNDTSVCKYLDDVDYCHTDHWLVPCDNYYSRCLYDHLISNLSDCRVYGRNMTDCAQVLGARYQDYRYCSSIDDNITRAICMYQDIDIAKDCDGSAFTKDLCAYKRTVQLPHDARYGSGDCLHISTGLYRNKCLFFLALETGNASICTMIDDAVPLPVTIPAVNDTPKHLENAPGQPYWRSDTPYTLYDANATDVRSCVDAIHLMAERHSDATDQLFRLNEIY